MRIEVAIRRAWWCAGLLLLTGREAGAYTDPGSGMLIWQMLVAGFVGALFYIRKILSKFRARKSNNLRQEKSED